MMGELTAEQHETLRLHFYEGYTLAEIGKKLGQSLWEIFGIITTGGSENCVSRCEKVNCRTANRYVK